MTRGRVEDEELHEQATVEGLALAVFLTAVFEDVDGREAGRLLGFGRSWSPQGS